MMTYVILLRGINVGGKNKIVMAELKRFLEEQGFANVITYIQSGNVVLQSELEAEAIRQHIEERLPGQFRLDSSLIKVLVLTSSQLQQVVDARPAGFGEQPDKFHSDALFLIGMDAEQALSVFSPREGIDEIWPGTGVIYSQRLSAQLSKSHLNKIVGTRVYQAMTIRNWRTTTKLLDIVRKVEAEGGSP